MRPRRNSLFLAASVPRCGATVKCADPARSAGLRDESVPHARVPPLRSVPSVGGAWDTAGPAPACRRKGSDRRVLLMARDPGLLRCCDARRRRSPNGLEPLGAEAGAAASDTLRPSGNAGASRTSAATVSASSPADRRRLHCQAGTVQGCPGHPIRMPGIQHPPKACSSSSGAASRAAMKAPGRHSPRKCSSHGTVDGGTDRLSRAGGSEAGMERQATASQPSPPHRTCRRSHTRPRARCHSIRAAS